MAGDEGKDGQPKQKPEPNVLTDLSLSNLACHIDNGIMVAQYLNVPMVTIVKLKNQYNDDGWTDGELAQRLLRYWKEMRASAKDKEKVMELEKALREVGKIDVADTFNTRHGQNLELTTDCFSG